MEAVIRVTDCMYCRYHGPEEKMKFAYDKIGVEAFENDIELNGENYTIMVDQNEEDETIRAVSFLTRSFQSPSPSDFTHVENTSHVNNVKDAERFQALLCSKVVTPDPYIT